MPKALVWRAEYWVGLNSFKKVLGKILENIEQCAKLHNYIFQLHIRILSQLLQSVQSSFPPAMCTVGRLGRNLQWQECSSLLIRATGS